MPFYVKDSSHLVQLLKYTNLDNDDRLVSFDVESLYTNVPVDKALHVKSKLAKHQNLQS